MKRTSIRQTMRNFTILLAGLMLCVSSLAAQTAVRQRFTQADASPQEPQQKPKPTSNVDPLDILNAPEPPRKPTNPPAGQTPSTNKPNSTPQTPKDTTYSSSLDTVLSSNGIVAAWVPGNGASIPPNAVVAGNENGAPLYACRWRDKQNWVMVGKVVGEGCNYGLGKEKVSKQFEVLVGGGTWRQPTNSFAGAFDAGPDYTGEPRYLCRAPYQGGLHPGRLLNSGCYISYGGKAFSVPEYELFYSSAGALAASGASRTAANQRSTEMSSSLDPILGGAPTKRTVMIQVDTKVYLSETLRGDNVFSEACLFNLIDLNGGELESGDYVSVEHVQSKKVLLIDQNSKGLVPRLGSGSGGALAKIKILKLKEVNGRVKSSEGVIEKDDIIILETEDEQLFTFSGFFKQLKIENPKNLRQAFRIDIFTDEASALALARESREQEQEKDAEVARKRQARNDAIFNRIEQMKTDARNEQIRQAEEAQAIAAQKQAAREEEAKQAEARRQLEDFRNAEAEAKRLREEQAAREAAERQAAEQRAAEARLQQALSTPPSLFFPRSGETLRNGCSNHSANVTTAFTWGEVPSATAYQLYAKHSSAANPAVNETVRVPQFSRTDNSFVADHFRIGWTWKVRAFINGQWGAWSEERAFQYEPMNANPACRQ